MSVGISDLNTSLGAYHRQNANQIGSLLYQDLELEQYMASVPGVSDEWASAYGTIGKVLQPHQSGWVEQGQTNATTPGVQPGMVAAASGTGSAEIVFKPILHKVRQIDIKVSFDNLDNLYRSWIGWLTDEKKKKSEWPLVKYIIEGLIIPKGKEELNEVSVSGNYAAPTAGVPGSHLTAADGILTIIADQITATNIAPIASGSFTSSTIFANVESFVKAIPAKYRRSSNILFMSDADQFDMYVNYRATYGANSAVFDGNKLNIKIGNTMIQTVGISAWGTSHRFLFTTPGNMKKLYDKVDAINDFYVEDILGKLYIYMSFKRGYGFDKYEEVFVNDQA